MSAPAYDPNYIPPFFEMYVLDFVDMDTSAGILPENASDPRPDDFTYVGRVDGPTCYGYSGPGKKNPFTQLWQDGSPEAPFQYGTEYAVVYEGTDLMGGFVRCCIKDVTYARNATTGKVTGNAEYDDGGARAYWYYQPPAPDA